MNLNEAHLDDRYRQTHGRVFLSGTQALARLPMLQRERDRAAGLNTAGFISGYRGSPLGGLDKTLWQAAPYLEAHQVYFSPGINEDLAATAIWGSQQVNMFEGALYDGVFAMWYGKAPGVDRSGDVFKHGNHAGTSRHGGVLLIAGDDHGCKSSTLPSQTEYAFMDAMIPVLNPSGVQEIIDLGLQGWALSRFSGCWVALKTIAETVDGSYSTCIDPERVRIVEPRDFVVPDGGLHCRWPDKPLEQEIRLHNHKIEAVLAFARANGLNHMTLDSPAPRFGIVSTGKSYLDVLQALEDLGIDDELARSIGLRLYKVGMSWPLEPHGMREFASGLEEVLVVEEKRGLIEDQLTSQLYNWHTTVRPVVVGKRDESGNWLLPSRGELTPAGIARVIAARIDRYFTSPQIRERLDFLKRKEIALATAPRALERTPHFCSGCPHNISTRVPEGSRSGGGIGCHYMATWMDRRTETFTQMGGEGVPWIGQARFSTTQHVFQNLGDGTYFHSGLLAIRATIAAGVNITYKILYNDAVAMTGGQTIDGQLSVPQMAHQLYHEGVRRIVVVGEDPEKYDRHVFPAGVTFEKRDDLDRVQCELREEKGTTVLIYDQTCAAEKRRRARVSGNAQQAPAEVRAFINPRVCEGCGDCGEISSCLSLKPLETEYGRKRTIDQGSCNMDLSCVRGFCPSFVSVVGGRVRVPESGGEEPPMAGLPQPELPAIDQPYGIVLTGVGGTGVITLGAIIGMAAHIEGKGASVLDMTGLAQKFGPVISHVQVAEDADLIRAQRIAAGGARLLLGCDLVVAASFDAIAKVDRAHTSAVINSHPAVTAEFTRDPDLEFPSSRMQANIQRAIGRGKTHFIDGTAFTEKVLGNSLAANIFMLGFAWQKGLVPVSEAALLRAIELNGRDIQLNARAFRWGRVMAHDPARRDAFAAAEEFRPLDTLEAVIADRRELLTRYQDRRYADRFEALVRRAADAEARAGSDGDALALSVARNYSRVLAYKDEYEVARLYTDGTFASELAHEFDGDYRLRVHLAPPLFARKDPHTGVPRKIAFGGWILPVLKLLAHGRRLRGTWLDPFAWTSERKLDRVVIAHYEELVEMVLAGLTHENMRAALALAELPARVRGFGHIKERNWRRALLEERELVANWRRDSAVPVRFLAETGVEVVDPHESELV